MNTNQETTPAKPLPPRRSSILKNPIPPAPPPTSNTRQISNVKPATSRRLRRKRSLPTRTTLSGSSRRNHLCGIQRSRISMRHLHLCW